jgi:hypothetical protein
VVVKGTDLSEVGEDEGSDHEGPWLLRGLLSPSDSHRPWSSIAHGVRSPTHLCIIVSRALHR